MSIKPQLSTKDERVTRIEFHLALKEGRVSSTPAPRVPLYPRGTLSSCKQALMPLMFDFRAVMFQVQAFADSELSIITCTLCKYTIVNYGLN